MSEETTSVIELDAPELEQIQVLANNYVSGNNVKDALMRILNDSVVTWLTEFKPSVIVSRFVRAIERAADDMSQATTNGKNLTAFASDNAGARTEIRRVVKAIQAREDWRSTAKTADFDIDNTNFEFLARIGGAANKVLKAGGYVEDLLATVKTGRNGTFTKDGLEKATAAYLATLTPVEPETTEDTDEDVDASASDEPDQKVRNMVLDLSTEIMSHADEFDRTTAEWLMNTLSDLVGEVSKRAEI